MRFSSRTPASLAATRLSASWEALRAAGAPLIDLTVSNPTRAGLMTPGDEVMAALGDRRSLVYEPSPRGPLETRTAICAYHARQGAAVDAGQVIVAGSTSESYSWLFKLLCEPGDAVMTPRPSYPLFECLATLDAVRAVEYPLIEELRWGLDVAAIERSLDERARALIVVNPNNPTGTYLKRDEWLRLQEFAALRGLAVIVDEVFFDSAWGLDPRRVSSLAGPHLALTFTLSGLSKVAALPQMKLGWVCVSGPGREEALERLEWIADSYLPVSAPVLYAAPAWLDLAPGMQRAIGERVGENLAALGAAFVEGSPWRLLPAEGGWVALVEAPRIHSEEEWALLLAERHGVLAQPGYFYDFEREAFLALSLLPEPEAFREALLRLGGNFRPV